MDKPHIVTIAYLENEKQLQKLLESVDELKKNFDVSFNIKFDVSFNIKLEKRRPIL